jgi:hypothetical protein
LTPADHHHRPSCGLVEDAIANESAQVRALREEAALDDDRSPNIVNLVEALPLSHAADPDQLLGERYPDERLADEVHQRYLDARTALRHKAHS